jgi:hypothetical protein
VVVEVEHSNGPSWLTHLVVTIVQWWLVQVGCTETAPKRLSN